MIYIKLLWILKFVVIKKKWFSTNKKYFMVTKIVLKSHINHNIIYFQIPMKGPPLKKVSTPGSASLAANLQRFTTPDFQGETSTEATSSYQLPGLVLPI